MLLIKYKDNCADEFDVCGFDLVTEKWWEEYVRAVTEDLDYPQETYVGTNEFITYTSAEEHLSNFKVVPITDEEVDTLNKLFNYYERGKVQYLEE